MKELIKHWESLNDKPIPTCFMERPWISYGYKEHAGMFRTSNSDTYELRFNQKILRPVGTVIEEGIITANKIADKFHGERFIIFLSGGLDSHFVAKSFMDAGIPFEALIIRHKSGINSHDSIGAIKFALENKIPYTLFDIDILEIIKSGELTELAMYSQCKHIAYAPWGKAISANKDRGICITGFNEPEIFWKPNLESQMFDRDYTKGDWVFNDMERYPSFNKYLQAFDIVAIPSFFQYTMELWSAFFVENVILRLVGNRYTRQVHSSDSLKYLIYNLNRRVKLTGYERIITEIFLESDRLQSIMPVSCKASIDIPHREVLKLTGLIK